MSYAEDEYLMISGIQHFAFCRRQWALIHMEQLWAENRLTAEGQAVHRRAHDADFREKRPGLLIVRGLRVASAELGVSGQCDVVEFQEAPDGVILHGHRGTWSVCPVEYKRGKDKEDDSDILQLCCEAMCLEEMLACHIPTGCLFYHELRRRRTVELTEALRETVKDTLADMHQCFRRGVTPKVKPQKKCQSCSLRDLCMPRLSRSGSARTYLERALRESS